MNRPEPADTIEHRTASPDEIEKQAWIWLRLLAAGEPKEWDLQGFRRWLRADPAHRTRFNEVRRRWEEIGPAVGVMQRGSELKPELKSARTLRAGMPRRPYSHSGRRAFLGAAVSAVAVAGVAAVYPPLGLWPALSEWGADYRTGAGEQRTLALADRVSVMLNTRTSIRQKTAGGQTIGLDLIDGEAAVDLQGGRSFAVTAGVGRSVAESGRFEVRYLDNKVCVTCIDGAVRVEHPAGTLALQARQQAIYDAHALSNIASVEPAQISAWRNGELLFSQVRLGDVIAEINRYRPGRVMLINDAVRNKTVNGRFAIASLDLALAQLQLTFGLKARSLPGSLMILS
jgi:transmembrane sensor